ncbi:ATP-binding cassette domain-containing protein [Streptomyces sp. NBC_01622]|nr:ATP-binding cassette domain-containing protein [Streptomyces sp. NBC_01622]
MENVSRKVDRGKAAAVVGPSGCGRSTILDLAAGLLTPTDGEVHYAGERVTGVNSDAASVTQHSHLLPWLSVKADIGLAPKSRNVVKDEREKCVAQWVDLGGGVPQSCRTVRAVSQPPVPRRPPCEPRVRPPRCRPPSTHCRRRGPRRGSDGFPR